MHISHTMNVSVFEMLENVNKLAETNREEAIQFLRNSRGRTVMEGYLRLNFDPSVVFQLPAGTPPFKKQMDVPDGYCMTDLKQEFRRMRVFIDPMNISKVRREQLWIQMLEGLFWKEADMINKIKDHRLTDMMPNITAELVREAFPNLIPADKVAEPLDDTPVENVVEDDPSKIPEEDLIKASVEEYLRLEEEAKKAMTGAPEATAPVKTRQPRSAKTTPETPEVKERKKPGPKPKVPSTELPQEPLVKERKKPGPKPKSQS